MTGKLKRVDLKEGSRVPTSAGAAAGAAEGLRLLNDWEAAASAPERRFEGSRLPHTAGTVARGSPACHITSLQLAFVDSGGEI